MGRSTKKRAAPATQLPTATSRTAVKVLKGGASWHGGEHAWSLPTQQPDGTWTPGDWTPSVKPKLCQSGWHLTQQPACWWGDDDSVVGYLAEYDGKVSGPDADDSDATKIAVERCRLLRPLTHEELADRGVFLSGEHEAITGGINYVSGGTINYVSGGTINYVSGGTINDISGGTINYVRGGTINYISGGTINDVSGGTINDVRGGTINYVRGGTINYIRGGTINYVRGGTINDVRGGTINDVRGGTITAHASSAAVIVVRWGAPTVVLRDRASALDYRQQRPVHHIAGEGQVLTLAPDGTVTQAPAQETP